VPSRDSSMQQQPSPGASLREAAGLGGGDALEAALHRALDAGRCAWPALPVSSVAFVQHMARHLPEPAAPDAGLAALHTADLYLACACLERLDGAIEAFVVRHAPDIEVALRGRRVSAQAADELRQVILDKLLVGRAGKPPKIRDYAGRGPLGGWVRVAAVRTALNFLAQEKGDRLHAEAAARGSYPAITGVATAPAAPAAQDPELTFFKSQYRDEVSRALKDALDALPADARNVLRLYFLDGLSIDRIAAVYGVHRATAARWVNRGREALRQRTRLLLGRRLHIGREEVDSLVGLVRSQLDLTISSLFRSTMSRRN